MAVPSYRSTFAAGVLACAIAAAPAAPAIAQDAAAPATPAAAADPALATFQARYVELRAAMEERDPAALGKILAPEYQVHDIRGEVRDGKALIARLAQMPKGDNGRKMETTVLKAVITGDTALVDQRVLASGKRTGDDGNDHTMEMELVSKDSWARRGDAWLLVKSEQTGITVKRDGEVFFTQQK